MDLGSGAIGPMEYTWGDAAAYRASPKSQPSTQLAPPSIRDNVRQTILIALTLIGIMSACSSPATPSTSMPPNLEIATWENSLVSHGHIISGNFFTRWRMCGCDDTRRNKTRRVPSRHYRHKEWNSFTCCTLTAQQTARSGGLWLRNR